MSTHRMTTLALLLLAAGLSAGAQPKPAPRQTPAARAARAKLLPGAEGKLCLDCHTAFKPALDKRVLHTPVKAKDCVSCHDPHASRHGKLLDAVGNAVCQQCHPNVVPAQAKSTHGPVVDGKCATCHDPHASDQPDVLVKPQAELCAGCHQPIADRVSKAKVKHAPVSEKGCDTCHDAHASSKSTALLLKPEPDLCVACHDTKTGQFARSHVGYPVAKASCSTCHDPHGSDTRGLLRNNVHPPVAQRECARCHNEANDKSPLAVRQQGEALCRGCHADQVKAILDKPRLHWAVSAQDGCLNCHDPHASTGPKLVDARLEAVCGRCHQDTLARHQQSPTKHPPIAKGECSKCHDPHGSPNLALLAKSDTIELCGTCHDWQRHSTHPIGAKVKDPRNANVTLDCLSCHRSHGTEYKHLVPFPTASDLCTTCHQQYKR